MTQRMKRIERRSALLLLVALVTFLATQQLGGWLLHAYFPGVRFAGLVEVVRQPEARPQLPHAAFLGSSRFGCGIRMETIRSAWREAGLEGLGEPARFAVPAGDFIALEYLWQRLERAGIQPRLVVLEISPETVADRTFWLNFHVIRQLGWVDTWRYARELVERRLLRKQLLGQALPLWMHRQAIRHELTRWLLPSLPPRNPGVLEGDADRAAARETLRLAALRTPLWQRIEQGLLPLRRWLRQGEYRVGGQNWAALRRLLTGLHAKGISVVLARVPVTEAHRQLYSGAVEERFQDALANLRQEFPGLTVIEPQALADEAFEDNHHLTAEGGNAYSRYLVRRLAVLVQSRSLAIR